MSLTKQQIIDLAFGELGFGTAYYGHSAEEYADCKAVLDAMMAGWAARNVVFDQAYPAAGGLDAETNAPDTDVEAMYLCLAVRLAPRYGKAVPPATAIAAQKAYSDIMRRYAKPVTYSTERTVSGAGNKGAYGTFNSP